MGIKEMLDRAHPQINAIKHAFEGMDAELDNHLAAVSSRMQELIDQD